MLGHVPSRREKDYLRRMTMVMGNRNQLQWDIPALDSFELNRAIYRLRREDFLAMRDELVELLDVGDLVRKPVRNLSLGERMKVEIVGSLLHRPQVLFLDEPTIGLDVTMQKRIRTFVAEYNQRHGATVLLTSHYMADVEALCKRVIVIHHGRILFDGELSPASRTSSPRTRRSACCCENGNARARRLRRGHLIATATARRCAYRRPRPRASPRRLLSEHEVLDLTIEEPPIEDVIELVFAQPTMSADASHRCRRKDASGSLVDFYGTMMRTSVVAQLQYRVANYFYMLGMVAEPVIYLVVWSTIARQHGGAVNGITAGAVRRVLHRLDARPEHEHRLRRPVLGVAHPRRPLAGDLLRPLNILHYDLAYFAGWKFVVVALWIPIAIGLSAVFHPDLTRPCSRSSSSSSRSGAPTSSAACSRRRSGC